MKRVSALSAPPRIIPLPGAGHNSPIEGTGLTDFYKALDWLVPKAQTPAVSPSDISQTN